MALEIKGLKANMLKVQKRIETINGLAAGFDDKGAALEQGLRDITAQVEAHGSDLEFAASVLGNSSDDSQKPVERPTAEHGSITEGGPSAQSAPMPDGRTFQRIG